MAHQVIVVGAGYAGLVTALRVARRCRPEEVAVTLVNARAEFCERPRLHQVAAGQQVRRFPLSAYLADSPVLLEVGTVDAVDTSARTVTSRSSTGTRMLCYDTLVLALGSLIDSRSVPGLATYAHRLDDYRSAERLQEAVTAVAARQGRVAVCGGGMTGIEVATELAERHRGLQVELVSRAEPGAWLSQRGRRYLDGVLADLGVVVRTGYGVDHVADDHLRLEDGRRVRFDLAVWAGGFTVPDLAREAGLDVDAAGRVRVDRTLRSASHPDVYAVGDAAAVSGPWGDALAMGCRTGGFTGPAAADAISARLAGRTSRQMRFRYIHECISLGRRRGVVQFLDRDGTPKDRVLTGRAAITYKNATLGGAHLLFRWPGPYLPRRRRPILPTPAPVGTGGGRRDAG